MINNDMRLYNFYTFGESNGYGQAALSADVKGQVKIAINVVSHGTVDNILYKESTYIGLTQDKNINDTYVIDYNGEKLKVLYINAKGRYKQVYLKGME